MSAVPRPDPAEVDAAIKIESGVPLLDPYGGRNPVSRLVEQMQVGDSFVRPHGASFTIQGIRSVFQKRGWKCAIRHLPDGTYRIWRQA